MSKATHLEERISGSLQMFLCEEKWVGAGTAAPRCAGVVYCISPQLLYSCVEGGTMRTAQHLRWRPPCLTEQKAFLLPSHLALTLNSCKKVRVEIKCIEEVQI